MANSQDLLNQLDAYKNPQAIANQIEQSIRDAYAPGMKGLIDEGNALRNNAQTTYFDTLKNMGTGATDASAATQFSGAFQRANTAYKPYEQNLGLRDYYKADVGGLVDKGTGLFNSALSGLKDQYNTQYTREQNDRNYQLQQQQLAASKAAAAGPTIDWSKINVSQDTPNTSGQPKYTSQQIADSYNQGIKSYGLSSSNALKLMKLFPGLPLDQAMMTYGKNPTYYAGLATSAGM